MEERTFDLTVPVTRPFRVIWNIAGVRLDHLRFRECVWKHNPRRRANRAGSGFPGFQRTPAASKQVHCHIFRCEVGG